MKLCGKTKVLKPLCDVFTDETLFKWPKEFLCRPETDDKKEIIIEFKRTLEVEEMQRRGKKVVRTKRVVKPKLYLIEPDERIGKTEPEDFL